MKKIGDSGRTRTPNLLIRSQLLYPVELRNRCRAVVPDLTGLVQYRPSAPAHRQIKNIAPSHHWSHADETLVKDPVKWIAPAGWRFDIDDWWLDENGLIMRAPEFPISVGQYYVTNGEDHISLLTIGAPDKDGKQAWSLSDGKTLKDVTHGPCRSARYTPVGTSGTCTPEKANLSDFPLAPGEDVPAIEMCNRQIYAVLIVFGFPVES